MSHQVAELRHAAVVAELDEERAATLGRADERIRAARELGLRALALLDAGHDALADYRAARSEMDHWRWVLTVQREALGLCDHRWVDSVYPPLPRR
jgi:hypothetical protein